MNVQLRIPISRFSAYNSFCQPQSSLKYNLFDSKKGSFCLAGMPKSASSAIAEHCRADLRLSANNSLIMDSFCVFYVNESSPRMRLSDSIFPCIPEWYIHCTIIIYLHRNLRKINKNVHTLHHMIMYNAWLNKTPCLNSTHLHLCIASTHCYIMFIYISFFCFTLLFQFFNAL